MAIALALLERREAAQEDEAVRILDVEQRPEHVHAIRTHAGHGTRLEEADEFGAPAGLDTIGAHFDDHAIPPQLEIHEILPSEREAARRLLQAAGGWGAYLMRRSSANCCRARSERWLRSRTARWSGSCAR